MNTAKPTPNPSRLTQGYWDQIQKRQLVVMKCQTCRATVFFPKAWCPSCLSTEMTWSPVSGLGTILTYTIVHQAPFDSYRESVPYVIALVEMADAAMQMMTNIVNVAPEQVAIGMAVQVVFEERTRNGAPFLVPQFEPMVKALDKEGGL